MESQIINCPNCKQATAAKASLAGKSVRCPHCRSIFQVPQKEVKAVKEDVDDSLPTISVGEKSYSSSAMKKKPGVPIWVTASAFGLLMVLVVWNGAYLQNAFRSFTGLGMVDVSGEVFFTTKAGSVAKGAGLEVYMSPMNPTSKRDFVATLAKRASLKNEMDKLLSKSGLPEIDGGENIDDFLKRRDRLYDQFRAKNPRYGEALREAKYLEEQAQKILTDGMITMQTNSEGKFRAAIPPGDYVLWTSTNVYGEEAFIWCMTVKVENSTQFIYANDEHIISTKHYSSDTTSLAFLRMGKPMPNDVQLKASMFSQLTEKFTISLK